MTQAAEKAGKKAIMQRRLCACRLATFLTILILGVLGLQAQEATETDKTENPKTSIGLTAQQVRPGSPAYFTVMLTNNPAADVSELREWIEFPKDKISYVSARLSIAGDLAEAELKVEVQDKADAPAADKGNVGVLAVSIIGKKPIPDGPVAEITFQIPPTAGEETLPLGHRVEATAPDGKKLTSLVVEPVSLKISKETPQLAPAIMSCFFYMH